MTTQYKIFLATFGLVMFFGIWCVNVITTDARQINEQKTSEDKFKCTPFVMYFVCFDHIIKQNDWLICAEIHKSTHVYRYEYTPLGVKDRGMNANSYEDLIRLCGEIPK